MTPMRRRRNLIILHRSEVRREMQQAEWQALRQRGSSLEQEYMALVKT